MVAFSDVAPSTAIGPQYMGQTHHMTVIHGAAPTLLLMGGDTMLQLSQHHIGPCNNTGRCPCNCQVGTPTQGFVNRGLASPWEGVGLPRASGKSPDFPGSSPNFPGSFSATSPEVLSLWNFTAIQGFPGSFPDFPGSFPDFPGGQPFLWEA